MERNGSKATFVNVLIVTDSQHGLEIFRRGGGGGLWQSEEGPRASWAFISSFFFLPVCLSYLFLSFPGRAQLLAGSQTEGERMISFRTVGGIFPQPVPENVQALVGERGNEMGGGFLQ